MTEPEEDSGKSIHVNETRITVSLYGQADLIPKMILNSHMATRGTTLKSKEIDCGSCWYRMRS